MPRRWVGDPCSVSGCNTVLGRNGRRGMCTMHYERVRKHGDPHYVQVGRPIGQENPGTPKAETTPTTAELYWAAGFLEGEGNFYHKKHKDKLTSETVTAKQRNRDPLETLQRLFGGSIYCSQKTGEPMYAWAVHGSRARGVALTLYSLLSSRRQLQIQEALQRGPGGTYRQAGGGVRRVPSQKAA